MLVMDYKQQSSQGCLVVDLMYLFQIQPTPETERQILSDGLFRQRENFVLGCLLAFLDRYEHTSVTLYVDNKYFIGVLKQWSTHPRLRMIYQKNDQQLLDTLDSPCIVYVDNNITDSWTHLPHFMLITKATEKFYEVFDPWEGKTFKMSKTKLLNGIDLLRSHVKICPFIIAAQ